MEAELETLRKAPVSASYCLTRAVLYSTAIQPPIKQLEENHGYLTRDKVKFEECIVVYEERKQRLANTIAVTEDEIARMSEYSVQSRRTTSLTTRSQ